jgi:hypothetical protein
LSWTRPSALLLLALAAGPAPAALPDEIQVYTDDLETPGERGVELHVNTTPSGRSTPDYPGEVTPWHSLRVTPEISWGIARDWDWGLYLPFVRSAEGDYAFAGPKLRLKWLPLRPAAGGSGAFAGLNGELAYVEEKFVQARKTLELRPILGWRGGKWLAAVNPTLGMDLAGDEQGVATFHPSAKLSRDIGATRALGVEYYADFGRLSHFAPRDEQEHTLYLVLDTEPAGRWPGLNFGIGRGLTSVTDRWTIKAILSF